LTLTINCTHIVDFEVREKLRHDLKLELPRAFAVFAGRDGEKRRFGDQQGFFGTRIAENLHKWEGDRGTDGWTDLLTD
jgi:hypothetical protein